MVIPEDFFDEPPEQVDRAIEVAGPVWRWRPTSGATAASWFFLSINGAGADAIRSMAKGRSRGFGSVRVTVEIGRSRWQTSLFPNKEEGGYLLPLKAEIRRSEGIVEGHEVRATLRNCP